MYGMLLGELIMVSLFEMTREMTMVEKYWVPAIVIATLALSLIWMIREPRLKDRKEEYV